MAYVITTIARGNMELPRAQASIGVDDALTILRGQGVLVIENVLSAEQLCAVNSELEPWFAAAFAGEGPFFGRATRRFGGLFAKAASTNDLALHPLVLPLIERVLIGDSDHPRCERIELNLAQAIGIEPGEGAQFLHRDESLWPFAHDYELMANAMWALDDFTEENGATRLIPGSHLWSRDRMPEPGEALPAIAPAGSVIIWLGGLLHGGGANNSEAIRRGVVMSFRLGWLAPAEKLLLSTPQAIARKLPERLQQLIGYQLHRPNLGWVEGQDPIAWLNGEFEDLAPVGDNLAPMQAQLMADATANPDAYAGFSYMKQSPVRRGGRVESSAIPATDAMLEDDLIELAVLTAGTGAMAIALLTQLIAMIAKVEADQGETAALAIVEKAERSVMKAKEPRPS